MPNDNSSRQKNSLAQRHFIFIAVSLIIILGFLAYANSLHGQFLWDDYSLVKDNLYIRSWSNIANVFTKNIAAGAGKENNAYRPLQILSYMFDYSLWKFDVRGYHLSNILLHILAALTLFWLINLLFKDRLLSLFASILFLIHPIHTEAVAYISGRSDSLALLFILLAFIFYLKLLQQKKAHFYIFMLVSYALALLSRENSLILPLLLVLYHYSFKKRVEVKQFLSISVLALIYILLRFTVLGYMLSYKSYSTVSDVPTTILQRMPSFFVAITNYVRLLFSPSSLHMEYGKILFRFSNPACVLGILILSTLLILAWAKRNSQQLAFFSISWFFITLLPVSNLFPINAYMAEHWLYLPSIGFFLILARLLCYIWRDKNFKILAMVSLLFIVTFYSYVTIKQNKFWQSPILFYTRTLRYNPTSPRIYNNLAIAYQRVGKFEKAITLYKQAMKIDPTYVSLYNNLAAAYYYLGREEEAVPLLKQSIKLDSTNTTLYNNLATIYKRLGKRQEAIALLKEAIAIDHTCAMTYNNLGVFYHQKGQYKDAISLYRKAMELNPSYAKAYNNLAHIYYRTNKQEEAIALLKKAIAVCPGYANTYNNLALCYFEKKQYKLAIEYYDQAEDLGLHNPELSEPFNSYR